jgi:coronin-1B/1C/6
MGCETARLMKLTNNSVEPLCFFVPRKSEVFQEDLYPDTISPEPSHTADEWLAGSNKPPKLMSLNPSAAGASSMVASKPKPTATAPKTIPVLQAELAQANARIKELEDRLKSAGLSIN